MNTSTKPNPETEATQRLELDDPSGDQQGLWVKPIGENLYRCMRSSDATRDYMIYWGDEFQTEIKPNGHHQLTRLYARADIVHLKADLGLFLYGGPPADRNAAQDALGEGLLPESLLNFLKSYGGHAELDDFLIGVCLTIHVPREHQHTMLAALPLVASNYSGTDFMEARSGEADPWIYEKHVVLLGDSILDNSFYVPDGPAIIEQLQEQLPSEWQATLLAVDGSLAHDVLDQLNKLPAEASHIIISCGGNDALMANSIVKESVSNVNDALSKLSLLREEFRESYRQVLAAATKKCNRVTVCTIYDAIPGLAAELKTALALFNDVILFEAAKASIPVIDLRLICDAAEDYSLISPIEPSGQGGLKIAKAITSRVVQYSPWPV